MLSKIFNKSQQARENKKAFETLRRSASQGHENSELNEEDQEEDGFLVYGETEKERNTIKPLPAPPSYDMHQQFALCSLSSPTSDVCGNQAEHSPGAFQPKYEFDSSDQMSKVSPLNGVPFKLSTTASLMLGNTLGDMSIPSVKTFEPQKFQYDFTHEHSVVKEV